MNPLRLAISFLLIPRLFLSLIFFPLILSLAFVYFQLFTSDLVLKRININSKLQEETIKQRDDNNIVRKLVFGSGKRLPDPIICRWKELVVPGKGTIESAPNDACSPSRLDLAIHYPNISQEELNKYISTFSGNVERIHICKSCTPDIVIKPNGAQTVTEIQSIWAALIVGLANSSKELNDIYLKAIRKSESLSDILGNKVLYLYGYKDGIILKSAEAQAVVLINILSLIVISMWLALKAHRKVLDYFSRSGSLLPLVAATGKRSFYAAVWILTVLRVAAFLLAAVPFTIFTFSASLEGGFDLKSFFEDGNVLLLWTIAIISSLAFATLIASIAELKHRHSILSFAYKYIPLLCCCAGATVWAFTFLFETNSAHIIRVLVSALPILGMGPIALAPIIKPDIGVMATHLVTTTFLFVAALRYNAKWFAAHLEDL